MTTIDGEILTENGWLAGRIGFDETISQLEADGQASSDRLILPGFIDLHVHGGGGGDCMDGEDATRAMTRCHARFGTTGLLVTTMTSPAAALIRALEGIGSVISRPEMNASAVLGVHLEGPFISPDQLGAQPPFARPADIGAFDRYAAMAPTRMITLAPEEDPDFALIRHASACGVRVQMAHSTADAETTLAALEAGATGFTHLYNAMVGLHHRKPGMVGAALARARHAELIVDRIHVDDLAIMAAVRAIPLVHAVTDGTAACGMPDGEYTLGRHRVRRSGNRVQLANGGLAGSCLTMDQGLRNLVAIGLEVEMASALCSTRPAAYLGLADRGRIETGLRADLVVLNTDLALESVYVAGQLVTDR
ncbi:MAG: N-acetylglucosamine-6-phosphate deacetylase [Geminicoccaceae bacterium]